MFQLLLLTSHDCWWYSSGETRKTCLNLLDHTLLQPVWVLLSSFFSIWPFSWCLKSVRQISFSAKSLVRLHTAAGKWISRKAFQGKITCSLSVRDLSLWRWSFFYAKWASCCHLCFFFSFIHQRELFLILYHKLSETYLILIKKQTLIKMSLCKVKVELATLQD